MKPGDHPDFYRLAPPPGQSRESRIRLDRRGRFWHDDTLIEHEGLRAALPRWLARHPDDARFILTNGYDWCYLAVEDAPFFVVALHLSHEPPELELSDATREPLVAAALCLGREGELRTPVKQGRFEARFTRHAQLALEPLLREREDGALCLAVGGALCPIPMETTAPPV